MIEDLARLPMFRGVKVDSLESLLEHLEVKRYRIGETVFEQGDEADGALILVQGQLEAQVASGETERVVGKVHPGELCGEAGFFHRKGIRNARVVASRESLCLCLQPESMQATLGNPAMVAIERHLVSSIVRRIRDTNLGIQKVWKEQAARERQSTSDADSKRTLLGQLRGLFGGRR